MHHLFLFPLLATFAGLMAATVAEIRRENPYAGPGRHHLRRSSVVDLSRRYWRHW